MKHGYSYILLSFKIQLICTVTPSSSNAEETHNTLKFAHRAKHIEIQAAQNTVYWRFFFFRILFLYNCTVQNTNAAPNQGIITTLPLYNAKYNMHSIQSAY